MTLLAFDTSTKVLSITLAEKNKILVQHNLNVDYTHSEFLLPLIKRSLEIAKVDKTKINAIGVVKGPGSFTGLRIGLSVAKGLSISLGAKIYAYTSLEALAANQLGAKEKVLAILPAQRGEVYGGLFDVNKDKPKLIGDYFLGNPETELENIIKSNQQIRIIGDGYRKFHHQINQLHDNLIVLPAFTQMADSRGIISLLNYDLANNAPSEETITLSPLYMRLSSAEERLLQQKDKQDD